MRHRNRHRQQPIEQFASEALGIDIAKLCDRLRKSIGECDERQRCWMDAFAALLDNSNMMHAPIGETIGQMKIKRSSGATAVAAMIHMRPSERLDARDDGAINDGVECGRCCTVGVDPTRESQAAKPTQGTWTFAVGFVLGCRQHDGGADLSAEVGQPRFNHAGVVDHGAVERQRKSVTGVADLSRCKLMDIFVGERGLHHDAVDQNIDGVDTPGIHRIDDISSEDFLTRTEERRLQRWLRF